MHDSLHFTAKAPVRLACAFIGIFLLLYLIAFAVVEFGSVREGRETAFQRLLASRGNSVDWVVLGASHALPLRFGNISERLTEDGGQSMTVLAEIGAGPLYNQFVFDQAVRDLQFTHLLYVVDSFAFASAEWNKVRVGERKLLARTPLRQSTAGTLTGMVLEEGVDPRALLDYLTGFSKLNPVERFPTAGWRGEADFARVFRPSRHATASRLSYLYPDGLAQPDTMERYLDTLENILNRAAQNGIKVTVVKLPLPKAMRQGLPEEHAFDKALAKRLEPRGIAFFDLSAELDDPKFYFDTDHLNQKGVEALYDQSLRSILSSD
ncbi:hypothetical protein [Roseibium sp.]|uniref:hypothetical protein n=1 Tax=Roseibium sp. TaxID=1936156 RepID=UPI003A96F5AC